MPTGRTVDSTQLLSPETLMDARADTKRTWAAKASCLNVEPELFFPLGDDPAEEARQICGRCRVQSHCLAYSVIADEPAGGWGGLDHSERHALRRQLQRRGQLPPPAEESAA